MKFEEALVHLKNGSNISRSCVEWDGYFLALVHDDGESIRFFDIHGWIDTNHAVNFSDLLAEDWVVIDG